MIHFSKAFICQALKKHVNFLNYFHFHQSRQTKQAFFTEKEGKAYCTGKHIKVTSSLLKLQNDKKIV